MANDLVRVTGEVTLVDVRSGISKAGKPYSITEATVLCQKVGAVTVTLSDRTKDVTEGMNVDWLVSVDVFGGRPQYRAMREWDVPKVGARSVSAAPAAAS